MSNETPSERQALLRAIIANPEDDALRLVYADWLEEHGTTGADRARAEFIRVQCELFRMRYGSPEYNSPHYTTCQNRVVELLNLYERVWLGELNLPPNRQTEWQFQRGMVARLYGSVRYLIEHGTTAFAAAPIEMIELKHITATNLAELLSQPVFIQIRGLKLTEDVIPPPLLTHLFETAPLSQLRALAFSVRLRYSRAGWQTRNILLAKILATRPDLGDLRRLSLSDSGIGDEGALALARSSFLSKLTFLNLSGCALARQTQIALRERFGTKLYLNGFDSSNFTLGEFC